LSTDIFLRLFTPEFVNSGAIFTLKNRRVRASRALKSQKNIHLRIDWKLFKNVTIGLAKIFPQRGMKMKKIIAVILFVFGMVFFSSNLSAAPVEVNSTNPVTATSDARQIAWILISSQPTVKFLGYVDYQLNRDGQPTTQVNGPATIEKINGVWQLTNLILNDLVLATPTKPLAGFPAGASDGSWISNFNFWISGNDKDGKETCYANFWTKSLGSNDPINFVINPANRLLLKQYTLPAGYDQTKLFLWLKDSNGNNYGHWSYDSSRGGFVIWVNPIVLYTWDVRYSRPDGTTEIIDIGGSLEIGMNLPAQKELSPINMSNVGGINTADFSSGWYAPDPVELVSTVNVEGNALRAYCLTLDLGGDACVLYTSVWNGLIEIRSADDPNQNPLQGPAALNFPAKQDLEWQNFQIPTGLGKVIITFIEDPAHPFTSEAFGFGIYKGTIGSGKG
jgi:hypothetical protein